MFCSWPTGNIKILLKQNTECTVKCGGPRWMLMKRSCAGVAMDVKQLVNMLPRTHGLSFPPSNLWGDCAADNLGPLPSRESLLVVVDYFSRYFEVVIWGLFWATFKQERRDITIPCKVVSFLTSHWLSLTRLIYRVLQCVGEVDWFEDTRQQKVNSKWKITLLKNVAFHLYPLGDRPIRCREKGMLPKWVIENQGLYALEKGKALVVQRTDNSYPADKSLSSG